MLDYFSHFLSGLLDLDRWIKRAIVIALDAVLCVFAVWIAFSLRLGSWMLWNDSIAITILLSLLFWLPIFFLSGVYRVVFRFAGAGTIFGLAKAVAVFTIPMLVVFGFYVIPGVPRTIALLHPILFFFLLALSRIVIRYLLVDILNMQTYQGVRRNVLIYGAGNSGQQLAASLRGEPSMILKAFMDDNENLAGQKLNGVPVFSSKMLEKVLHRYSITDVLLAFPNASRAEQKRIITSMSQYSLKVKMLPRLSHILDDKVSISDLRDVSVEDLLGRSSVKPDLSLMVHTVAGKTVMVTGAGGSIGSELCRQILKQNPNRLILAEISEVGLYFIDQELTDEVARSNDKIQVEIIPELVSVVERPQMKRLFEKWQPETVFHAAAYKHVPLVEANPLAGLKNNIFGTLNAALEAELTGVAHFILVSTDKAVRPTNVMGASKRCCELVLQALSHRGSKTRFAMVRFGNVLGSSGSVVPHFMRQIKQGGPITVTHRNITRYFMTIPEAAQLVIQAGAMAKGGEVYVLDMGESVRIIDLAESMINLSGLSIKNASNPNGDIEIIEIGLRPGEKLYEELLIGDNPQSTAHKKIMKAEESFLPWPELEDHLKIMQKNLAEGNSEAAISLLKTLVPEFMHNRDGY